MPILDDRCKSRVKNCRTVLSERDFQETRFNYFSLGGIHVEVREVNEQERWELTDYTWVRGQQKLAKHYGVGAYNLMLLIDQKIERHFLRGPMRFVILILFLVLFVPSLYAQGSPMHAGPEHSGVHATKSDIPERTDHPTGSAEKQAALDNQTDTTSTSSTTYVSAPSAPAPVYEPSADHTTSDEVEALAAKLRKMREAREAKAKKEKEAK